MDPALGFLLVVACACALGAALVKRLTHAIDTDEVLVVNDVLAGNET